MAFKNLHYIIVVGILHQRKKMIERAIERILESENLTATLQDDDAQWLIDWGIEQVRQLLKDVTDPEIADETTYKLMMVMRALNKFGTEDSITPENIHVFAEIYAEAYSQAKRLTPGEEELLAAALSSKPPLDVMQFLIEAVREPGKRPQADTRSSNTNNSQ